MHKIAQILIIFLFANTLIFAQAKGQLKGTVVDSDNQNALPGVNLIIKGTSLGTASDVNGNYVIENIPSGTYTFSASAIGYKTTSKSIEVQPGKTLIINFVLINKAVELQAVEITGRKETGYKSTHSFAGTKTAARIKDIPQAISYVTKELINDQLAYRTVEVVKNISGVNQFSRYDDFTMRGFRVNAGKTRLINGLRSIGFFGPQTILANIERLEVIKGPSSALFSNASPGGIMNFVTKKPLNEDRKALSFTTGSYNTFRAALDFTGPMNESKTLLYRLNLGYENSDFFRDLQKNKTIMVAPSISFLPSDRTRVNLDMVVTQFGGKLDRGQPIFGATANTKIDDPNNTPVSFAIGAVNDYQNTDALQLALSLNHLFTDNISFNASYMLFAREEDLYEHRTSNAFAVDSAGAPIPHLMGMQIINRERKDVADNLTSYFVIKLETGAISHQILVGVDYIQQSRPIGGGALRARRYLKIDGTVGNYKPANKDQFILDAQGNPVPNVPHFNLENPSYYIAYPHEYVFDRKTSYPTTKYYTYGFYIQEQLTWNKLKVLLGGRIESYNDLLNYTKDNEEKVTQSKFLPRLGLVYSLNDQINLYGTYTESYEPQRTSQMLPEQGGPFDPRSGNMVEFGAKGEFFDNLLSANLALYAITENNILVNANDPDNPDLLRQIGQEKATGVELDIMGRITPDLSITANYAYSIAKVTKSAVVEEVDRIKINAPEHQGGFWVKYHIGSGAFSGIELSLGANFVTERNLFDTFRPDRNGIPYGIKLPAYTIFDAGISYTIDKFRLGFVANNITDKVHWTGGYGFVRLFPGTPRNYLFSVGYTF